MRDALLAFANAERPPRLLNSTVLRLRDRLKFLPRIVIVRPTLTRIGDTSLIVGTAAVCRFEDFASAAPGIPRAAKAASDANSTIDG